MAAWLTIARKVQCGEPGWTRLINVARRRVLPSARRRSDVLQNVSERALEGALGEVQLPVRGHSFKFMVEHGCRSVD